jgi:streptogramin lyase
VVVGGLIATIVAVAPATAATIKTEGVTTGGPHAIAPSGDGTSVFVGARNCGYVGRFDIAARTFSSTPAGPCGTDGAGQGTGVVAMAEGPDGRLYFTLYDDGPVDGTGSVARINRDWTSFQSVQVGVHPLDIVRGPDGNMWFTVNGAPGRVGRIDPATFTPATFNVPGNVQGPRGIIVGSDNNLYVLGGESGKVWRVTTAATPAITEIDTGLSGPSFGQTGPDGKLWFTLLEGNGLRRLDPSGAEPSRTIGLSGNPWDVAFGEDGKAYVTQFTGNSIAQVVPATGAVTNLPLAGGANPVFIAAAPGGNIFAAGPGTNSIFEIVPDVAPRVTTGAAGPVEWNAATAAATVDPRGSATTVRVVFGPTADYGQATADASLAAADGPQGVSLSLTGLQPETTYHYRAEATNQFGTTAGADQTFTTPVAPDADGDGVRLPADCNDSDKSIKPGAREVFGDNVDQDCSGADLRVIGASLSAAWKAGRASTTVARLSARKVPAGGTVTLRCSGRSCPFKKKTKSVKKATKEINLTSLFRKRALPVKTKVTLQISGPGVAGRVFTFTVRRSRAPKRSLLCLAPGEKKPRACK